MALARSGRTLLRPTIRRRCFGSELTCDVASTIANPPGPSECTLGWPTFLAPVPHGVHVPFDSECSAPRGVPTPERDPYIGGKLNA